MGNEIKLDGFENISNLITPRKSVPTNAQKQTVAANTADVSVSMSTFSGMEVADSSPEDSARVVEMKRLIETGSYKVDTDTLAAKLFKNVFSKTIG